MGRCAFPLIDFLLPSTCFGCDSPLGVRQSLGACLDCWARLQPLPHACLRCALPNPDSTDLLGPARGVCARCLLRPPPLDEVHAAVAYEGVGRRFLLRIKLSLRPELLPAMGRLLAARVLQSGIAANCREIVPLPSHPWTRLRRGFWPAAELARVVGRTTGLPVRRGILVPRVRPRRPTKGLSRARRLALAGGGLRLRGPVAGSRILLIDDVMTTGSTLFSAGRMLRESGAAEVVGAVWARTLGNPLI